MSHTNEPNTDKDISTESGASKPVQEVSNETLVDNFSKLIADPKDRLAFLRSISSRPDKWSLRHKGPYYRAIFALQFKAVLDELMLNRKSRIYRYKDFPAFKSHNTLYLKIMQSKAYLLDHLDKDHKYKDFCQAVMIVKKKGIGVLIHLRDDLLLLDASTPNDFNPGYVGDEEHQAIRDKVDRFLETASPNQRLQIDNLVLSEEEQREIEIQVSQLTNIQYRITSDRILIIKE